MNIQEKISALGHSGSAFCLFRMPGTDVIQVALGLFDEEEKESPCFIIHPFDLDQDDVIRMGADYLGSIEGVDLNLLQAARTLSNKIKQRQSISDETYLKNCAKAIEEIKQGKLEKVVLHQVKERKTDLNPSEILLKALATYPRAFVSWVQLPTGENWIGASPETLLSRQGNAMQTMALAGTKTDEKIDWTAKEIHEQALVTEFIGFTLKRIGVKEIRQEGPKDRSAGHLIHLCTEMEFKTDIDESIILSALHPTPAVSGSPRKEAMMLLKELGMEQRSLYAGFLGLRGKDRSDYFVNLRCLSIYEGFAKVYVGGGITKDSIPASELDELEQKSTVMGAILKAHD